MKTLVVWYKLDDPEDRFESVNKMESPTETETEFDFVDLTIKTLLSTVSFELDQQLTRKLSRRVKDEEK